MSNTNNVRQGIRNIPEICYRHGLTKAVICPGSRNAPLILSFNKHPELECLSIVDERSAGYFALGMAQLKGQPVAVVCTSGTAVLNLAPSVSEAYYQNIPLIIFTADRPKEWIDQADGQTIRQTDIFKNYIKQSFDLPLETAHNDDLWYFNRTVSQAIDTAVQFPAGPVHINVPLREPLYTALPEAFNIPNLIKTSPHERKISEETLSSLVKKWNQFEKKIVIFGILRKNSLLNELAHKMAQREDTVVIAENISNVSGEDIIYAPEPLVASLNENEKQTCQPDLVLTIGEGIVSKRIKQYLRAYPPKEQWHIPTSGSYTDTFRCLSSILQTEPFSFLETLLDQSQSPANSKYNTLKKKNRDLVNLHQSYLSRVGFSDILAIHRVLSGIPGGAIVHLANSSPVRYAQLSPSKGSVSYFSNRGTSGIDGCVSTAAGSAFMSGKPVYLISGDLAFIYDSNALWNNYLHLNLKIVVINNNGGNIFSLIESGEEMEKARSFFETPHKVKIKALCEAYGAGYLECSSTEGIEEAMRNLGLSQGTCILEIKTDSKLNTRVFKEYYQFIKQA